MHGISRSSTSSTARDLSPMLRGPAAAEACQAVGLRLDMPAPAAACLENFWQFGKLFPNQQPAHCRPGDSAFTAPGGGWLQGEELRGFGQLRGLRCGASS